MDESKHTPSLQPAVRSGCVVRDVIEQERRAAYQRVIDATPVVSAEPTLPKPHEILAADDPTLMSLHASAEVAPVPMILYCPTCQKQHIDAPEPAVGWTNPHHSKHRCAFCKTEWRPFPYKTTGMTVEDFTRQKNELTEDDQVQVIEMAKTILTNDSAARVARVAAMMTEDHFVKIGVQMELYARFMCEPCDEVDHVRLWYVNRDGEMHQGDTIRWDTFLRSVLHVINVPDAGADVIIAMIKGVNSREEASDGSPNVNKG